MRKLLLLVVIALACVATSHTQTASTGILYASDFAQWSLPQGIGPAAGSIVWNGNVCTTSSNGYAFQAIRAGKTVKIVDADPAKTETVTITTASVTSSGCAMNAAMQYVHYTYTVTSGTAGLQEAIDYAARAIQTLIITSPGWAVAGGITNFITFAQGSYAVSIFDERTSIVTPYIWNGTNYIAMPFGYGATCAGGDLAGTFPNCTVVRVNGNPITNVVPSNISMVPVWNGAAYSARQLSFDDLTAAFAINSFTGGQNVEIGASVINPSFTASYSYTPNSAAITNTDGTSSPTNLVSPFTSGTVLGTFVKTTQTSTTFTLTAIAATTKTATQAISWLPRAFGGVGTSGATGLTASGSNANLAGASGTLTNAGISASQVNQVFGPYSPTGSQKVYVATTGGCTHTNWIDNNTGFAMPFNAGTSISFVNQNGSTVPMCLYESVNTFLSGSFAPKPTN